MKLLIHFQIQQLHHWSLGMDNWFHSILCNGCNYLFVLEFNPCWIILVKEVPGGNFKRVVYHGDAQTLKKKYAANNRIGWYKGLLGMKICSPMHAQQADKSERWNHYNDVIMGAIASQITSLIIVYWTIYSGVDQRKHQSFASLAFVREIHRWRGRCFHLMTSSCHNGLAKYLNITL